MTTLGGSELSIAMVRRGLSKLKSAAAINIISTLLIGIAAGTLVLGGHVGALMHAAAAPNIALGSLIMAIAILLVGSILALVALFAFLIPAFSALREYKEDRFGTPAKLIKIGYIGGFILLIIGTLVMIGIAASAAKVGAPAPALGSIIGVTAVIIIGAILLFIGQIGIIIGMFRLNDEFKTSSFLAAGILFIIGIFISILNFIGWILVFVGARSALNKVESGELGIKGETTPSL